MQAAGLRHARLFCVISTLVVPMQMAVILRGPATAAFAGAVVGAVAFAFTHRHAAGRFIAAGAILLLLVARGLFPFHFTRSAHSFGWIPFATLLGNEWYWASDVLLAKLFLYSASVWALRGAGLGIATASLATAALLVVIEVGQMRLAHTSDITDPLLALIIGVGFSAFLDRSKSHALAEVHTASPRAAPQE
jgi:hypothetical protein